MGIGAIGANFSGLSPARTSQGGNSELGSLERELNRLECEKRKAVEAKDMEKVKKLEKRIQEIKEKIEKLKRQANQSESAEQAPQSVPPLGEHIDQYA